MTAAAFGDLRLPVLAAPMFLVSNPDLVLAQCEAGVIGSFPALNAWPQQAFDAWLSENNPQLGNFLISLAAPIQVGIAASRGGDYRFALSTCRLLGTDIYRNVAIRASTSS
jgi:NAD(P)H-dependent flavin oxidoreductase YrpB (nitropropane dioxygenase family)